MHASMAFILLWRTMASVSAFVVARRSQPPIPSQHWLSNFLHSKLLDHFAKRYISGQIHVSFHDCLFAAVWHAVMDFGKILDASIPYLFYFHPPLPPPFSSGSIHISLTQTKLLPLLLPTRLGLAWLGRSSLPQDRLMSFADKWDHATMQILNLPLRLAYCRINHSPKPSFSSYLRRIHCFYEMRWASNGGSLSPDLGALHKLCEALQMQPQYLLIAWLD